VHFHLLILTLSGPETLPTTARVMYKRTNVA
jgi:hypothetical protein